MPYVKGPVLLSFAVAFVRNNLSTSQKLLRERTTTKGL